MTASNERSCDITVITALARLLLLSAFVGFFIPLAGQGPLYCAFEINVRAPDGRPIDRVPVALVKSDKTTFSQSTTDEKGVAKMCDAPLEYVDIVAGSDICGSVMVRHLPPSWPDTRRIYITYVGTPCNHFVVPQTCRVLLRIQDQNGRPVEGARLEVRAPRAPVSDTSDVFGRLFTSLRKGDSLEGVVAKGEFHSALISQKCMDVENIESKIVLNK